MTTHELRQIEHGDLRWPANDRLQLCIRIDHAPVLGILQTVLFNLGPEPFSDLGTWQRRTANNGSQLRARLYFLKQPTLRARHHVSPYRLTANQTVIGSLRTMLCRSLRSRRMPAACDSRKRRRDCHCLQTPPYSVTPGDARSWYTPHDWQRSAAT